MKYMGIIGVLLGISIVSGTIEPYQYEETKKSQAKQIVKLNKNNKGHKRYYGRESVLRLPAKKVVKR